MMRITEPGFFRFFKTKIKDKYHRKVISIQCNGAKRKVKLLPMGQIFELQRYKVNNRKTDLITELSDYFNEPAAMVEKRMSAVDEIVDKKFLAIDKKDTKKIQDF